MALIEVKEIHNTRYPEKEFTAKCIETSIIKKGKENPRPMISLVFEGKETPQEIHIGALDKISLTTGEVDTYFDVGKTIASLRKGYEDPKPPHTKYGGFGLSIEMDIEAGIFRTKPTIVGKTLHMVPINEREDVSTKGKYTNRAWVVTEIKDSTQTITAPETPKSSGLTPELKQEWEDFLIENLTEPTNEAGIHRNMVAKITDVAVRTLLAAVRKPALQELVKEGKLNIDDKGRYLVA